MRFSLRSYFCPCPWPLLLLCLSAAVAIAVILGRLRCFLRPFPLDCLDYAFLFFGPPGLGRLALLPGALLVTASVHGLSPLLCIERLSTIEAG